MHIWCSVNYHASSYCLSFTYSRGIDRLGLGIESLALRCLSVHRAEAFDAQLLPSLDHCGVPARDVLEGLLAGSVLLLGHNLVSLVDHEIGFSLCLDVTLCLEDNSARKNTQPLRLPSSKMRLRTSARWAINALASSAVPLWHQPSLRARGSFGMGGLLLEKKGQNQLK